MKRKQEWFYDKDFWEQYAPIIFDENRWAEVPGIADGIARLALNHNGRKRNGEQPKHLFLDLCCGFGRITLELARRGFSVTGVDIMETYLNTAREDAAYEGLSVEFIQKDVRNFRRKASFDTALNLYNSFGFFEKKSDDFLFARNAFYSLKKGGMFIIEVLGKEIAVRDYIETEWFERAGCTFCAETSPVDSWAGIRNRWVLIKDNNRFEKEFIQRLYAASELRSLLLEAGFSRVELYGDWDESPYNEKARILLALARK